MRTLTDVNIGSDLRSLLRLDSVLYRENKRAWARSSFINNGSIIHVDEETPSVATPLNTRQSEHSDLSTLSELLRHSKKVTERH